MESRKLHDLEWLERTCQLMSALKETILSLSNHLREEDTILKTKVLAHFEKTALGFLPVMKNLMVVQNQLSRYWEHREEVLDFERDQDFIAFWCKILLEETKQPKEALDKPCCDQADDFSNLNCQKHCIPLPETAESAENDIDKSALYEKFQQ